MSWSNIIKDNSNKINLHNQDLKLLIQKLREKLGNKINKIMKGFEK